MAIGVRSVNNAAGQASGSASASAVSIAVTSPTGLADKDRVFIGEMANTATMATPSGWNTLLLNQAVGTGASTSGGGARYVSIYWRDKDATWSTMPTLTLTSASNNSHWVGAIAITPTANKSFLPPTVSTVGGSYNSITTSYTDTSAAAFTTTTNALLLAFSAMNDNVTSSACAITQSGATFGTVTEQCDGGTATGHQVAGKLHTASVTTGASATITQTQTLASTQTQGETFFVNQAEGDPTGTFASTALPATSAWDNFQKMDTFHEDFSGTLAQWSQLPANETAVTISSGKAVISMGSNGVVNGITTGPTQFKLAESSLIVKVTALPSSSIGAYCGIGITDAFTMSTGGGGVQIVCGAGAWNVVDLWSEGAASATIDPAVNPWIKVSMVGDTITMATSTDGTSWTDFSSGPTPFSTTGPIVLSTYTLIAAGTTGNFQVDIVNPVTGSTGTIASAAQRAIAALTGYEQPEGTFASTGQRAVSAFTGTQTQSGAFASTGKPAVSSFAGVMQPAGTIASTGLPAASAFTGAQSQTGTVAGVAQRATSDFAGSALSGVSGTFDGAAQPAKAALTGTTDVSGTFAGIAQPATSVLAGAQSQAGAIAAAAKPAAGSFTGEETETGTIASAAQRAVAALTGAQSQQGSFAGVLPPAVSAWAVIQTQSGSFAATATPAAALFVGVIPNLGFFSSQAQPAWMVIIGGHVTEPPPPMPTFTPAGPASTQALSPEQFVTLHTLTGIQLYQFAPTDHTTCTWGRKLRDVSTLDLTAPPLGDVDRLPDLTPWVHWISVWDGDRDALLWTGPIQKATINRGGIAIAAGDHAALLTRTRNPTTKRWDAADPAWIADELWTAMLTHHGLNVKTIARPDPEGDRFDYRVITDAQMLDQTIGNLVQMGLRWTIVAGVPILGPMPLDPIATLDGEQDFLGDGPDLVIDGSATFNDVLVRGPDNLARAHTDLAGQSLETIVNVDSMFGVSNVTRAAQQYARHTGTIRKVLDVPSGTRLHPAAPVSLDELIPSARFVVDAYGVRQLMELHTVDVDATSEGVSVKVSMESVDEKIELADIAAKSTTTAGVR